MSAAQRALPGATASAALLALLWAPAVPGAPAAHAQETRGFAVLEAEPGYLTNAYLDPGFAAWNPAVQTAFGALGATGLLEWTGERTGVRLLGTGRWTAFADGTDAWQAYLLRARGDRELGAAWAGELDLALSEVRQTADQRALWVQGRLAWTASSRLRLSAGPGIAFRRLEAAGEAGPTEPPLPPLPGAPSGPGGDRVPATSYVASVGADVWAGGGWRLELRGSGSHTDADDLGVDFRGAAGSLRATRAFPGGGTLALGGGAEGFGYRSALDDPSAETPDSDLLWHGEVGWSQRLGRSAELRARLAALGSGASTDGEGGDGSGFDYYASVGLRLTVGGALGEAERQANLFTRTEDGVRVRVPYRGEGRLYLVGDFNGWADPGRPLEPAGDGVHAARLRLEPGVYRFRIRVREAGSERWLELPAGTATEDDGFGGENGVLVVGST